MSQEVKPVAHFAFSHLNKRVTVLGYPPVLGALLLIAAIMLFIFSVAFRSKLLGVFAGLYIPAFFLYTRKNMKAVKENRLEVISLIFFDSKRKTYIDKECVINQILQKNE